MTFQEFLITYNGRYVDFDGAWGNQCMDLEHIYLLECLGINNPNVLAAPCAKDVYNNFNTITGHELFDQIGNTPSGVPQEGDLMYWGNTTFGHVAIFIEGDQDSFRSFDQNFPLNCPCHVQNHINYSNVLGWLRFKGQPIQNNQTLIDQLRADRDKNWNLYQQEIQHTIQQEDIINEKQKTIDILTKENLDDKATIDTLQNEKEALKTDYSASQVDLKAVTDTLEKTKMDLEICISQRKEIGKYETKELISEIIKRFFKRG